MRDNLLLLARKQRTPHYHQDAARLCNSLAIADKKAQ